MTSKAVTPVGLNHVVLNVRDLEESHRFWTDVLGFKLVGALKPRPDRPNPPKMRFYSGVDNGRLSHHDLALMELPSLPEPGAGVPSALGHIAVTMPDRDAWLQQLEHLQACGVKFERRIEHGMTHSAYIRDPNGHSIEVVYDLPREVWEGDIDAAQNYAVPVATEGAAALIDRTEGIPVFKGPQPMPAE